MPEQIWMCKDCKGTYCTEHQARDCEKNHTHLLGCGVGKEDFMGNEDMFPTSITFNVIRHEPHENHLQDFVKYEVEYVKFGTKSFPA
jgi:hypothetical protein